MTDNLQDRYTKMVARRDLLKEYLLRPLREVRETTGLTSPQAIKDAQVLPDNLWRQMQAAYTQAERQCEALRIKLGAE